MQESTMKQIVTRLSASAALIAASAAPLYAQSWSWWNWFGGSSGGSTGGSTGGTTPVSVPEIDASAGLLAVAAVLAVLALVWERGRRQA